MLQILIWAACFIIIGIGYCGRYLEELVAIQKGAKKTTGIGFMILMTIVAVILILLSILQGTALTDFLKR
jgi:hypothetical protein